MALINWKDLPNTSTPLNAQNLNFNFNEVLNLIYPVGRVIIDETDTDYSNYLGFTWERTLVGVVPVGKDTSQTEFDTLGETGGEKTHKLSVDEMPSHTHNMYVANGGAPDEYDGYVPDPSTSVKPYKTWYLKYDIGNSGGDESHNNLQPYKVVNYWKRTA